MEAVQLMVAFEENGQIESAVGFVGVMDSENVYVCRTSLECGSTEKDYVKIQKADITDDTEKWKTVFQTKVFGMTVEWETGFEDERLISLDPVSNGELISKIDAIVEKYRKASYAS